MSKVRCQHSRFWAEPASSLNAVFSPPPHWVERARELSGDSVSKSINPVPESFTHTTSSFPKNPTSKYHPIED